MYEGAAGLPAFNPDVEASDLPARARALRLAEAAADALMISCPEYAHGIPGAFKNLLDWLVGSTTFPGIRVLVLNTSGRGSHHAQDALLEILRTMSAQPITGQPVCVPLPATGCSVGDILASPERCAELCLALDCLAGELAGQPANRDKLTKSSARAGASTKENL